MKQKIIYLCAPYSSSDQSIIDNRVIDVNRKAAELMMKGYVVFSPISHSHPISKYCNVDPCDNSFWLNQDLPFMRVCDEVWIYTLDGWKESKGIKREIEEAKSLNKPVRYI